MRHFEVTCHDCKSRGQYFVTEWPPLIYICADCTRIYRLIENNGSGVAFWQMLGYLK